MCTYSQVTFLQTLGIHTLELNNMSITSTIDMQLIPPLLNYVVQYNADI